jgi:hypothetical protein
MVACGDTSAVVWITVEVASIACSSPGTMLCPIPGSIIFLKRTRIV